MPLPRWLATSLFTRAMSRREPNSDAPKALPSVSGASSLSRDNSTRHMGRPNEDLRDHLTSINKAGGTYHRIDLGNGLVIEGDYDIHKYIDHYSIPSKLNGLSVLDVGTA